MNHILAEMLRERVGSSFEDEATFSADEVEQIITALEKVSPPPVPQVVGSELLTTIKEFAHWHHLNEVTIAAGKTPSDSEIDFEDTAWNRISRALATATDATQLQHVLSITQHPNVESPNREQSGIEAAIQQVTVADYATRLFDLHGFMLLETYRDKPAVTVTFPDLKQAQQFHTTLVELSTHRPRSGTATEGSGNGQ